MFNLESSTVLLTFVEFFAFWSFCSETIRARAMELG